MDMNRFLKKMLMGMSVVIIILAVLMVVLKPDFKEINQKANEGLPKMIDKVTRMDKIDVKPDSVTYHYTFVAYAPSQEDKKKISTGIIKSTCAKIGKELKGDMNYHFIYQLEDGSNYSSVIVDKAVCAKEAP